MKFYKIGFYTLLVLLLAMIGYNLWQNNALEQLHQHDKTQIGKATDEKSELQKNFDEALVRLDSVTTANDLLMSKLNKKNPKDSIIRNLTPAQLRILHLIDSTNVLRDSITRVGSHIIEILFTPKLDKEQAAQLKKTFSILGDMNLELSFSIDEQNLSLLKENAASLKELVGSFDKKIEKLDQFSKRLGSFTKYLQVAIDVFAVAVSQGVVVPRSVPIAGK